MAWSSLVHGNNILMAGLANMYTVQCKILPANKNFFFSFIFNVQKDIFDMESLWNFFIFSLLFHIMLAF